MHLGILHWALVVACNRTQLSMSNDEKFNEAMVEMIRPTHNTGLGLVDIFEIFPDQGHMKAFIHRSWSAKGFCSKIIILEGKF